MAPAVPVIAIDGPAGAGKGTAARLVAQQLGFRMLDSGALYRAAAAAVLAAGGDPASEQDAVAAIATLQPAAADDAGLRGEAVGAAASALAQLPEARAALLDAQRSARREPGLVADGRDMGTVVFPDADLKVFLTASVQERARRRAQQAPDATIDDCLRAIRMRDEADSSRHAAPLVQAPDAVRIDSTALSPGETADFIVGLFRQRRV